MGNRSEVFGSRNSIVSSKPKPAELACSPDENAAGLAQCATNPSRYSGERKLDPDEVPGIVARMIPVGSRVLDVGCGAGVLARVLADECHAHFVGVEPDSFRAEEAAERGLEVHFGYLTAELIRDLGSFDIVLFADVLEHLPNPQSVLLLAREALKPRGSLIVSVPNVAHWSVRLSLVRGKFEYWSFGIMDATHLRWFTADGIRSLLTSAGFKTLEYRATAGQGLPDNDGRAPLRWLSAKQRERFLRVWCKRWPTLFGAQHVLKARVE
jgi:methionine biosynthesis protein MetW